MFQLTQREGADRRCHSKVFVFCMALLLGATTLMAQNWKWSGVGGNLQLQSEFQPQGLGSFFDVEWMASQEIFEQRSSIRWEGLSYRRELMATSQDGLWLE